MSTVNPKPVRNSYRRLRRLIGILGIALPFLCLLGLAITKEPLQSSISHCYHTNVRDVFVGIMIGVGMFLITYSGYEKIDDIVNNMTGVVGIVLALCPCLLTQNTSKNIGYFNLNPYVSDAIHLACASGFFLLLAYNSIFLFTKSIDKRTMTRNKKKRNVIYRSCGIVMVALMAVLLALRLIVGEPEFDSAPIAFCIESLMLFAFGISWLVKGETIFRDKTILEKNEN